MTDQKKAPENKLDQLLTSTDGALIKLLIQDKSLEERRDALRHVFERACLECKDDAALQAFTYYLLASLDAHTADAQSEPEELRREYVEEREFRTLKTAWELVTSKHVESLNSLPETKKQLLAISLMLWQTCQSQELAKEIFDWFVQQCLDNELMRVSRLAHDSLFDSTSSPVNPLRLMDGYCTLIAMMKEGEDNESLEKLSTVLSRGLARRRGTLLDRTFQLASTLGEVDERTFEAALHNMEARRKTYEAVCALEKWAEENYKELSLSVGHAYLKGYHEVHVKIAADSSLSDATFSEISYLACKVLKEGGASTHRVIVHHRDSNREAVLRHR